jgi:hypothetical protein
VAAGAGVDADHLIDHVHRGELSLLEELHHPVAAIEPLLGGGVEIGAELGEGLELAEAREVETQTAGHLLHRLVWAAPPTRDTEMPTFMAGRWPAKKRSG